MTTSNMKTSPYAVASVYELDRKYVLIDINGLSISRASYFSRIDKETRFVNSILNSNPHRMFLLWLTPSIKFFSETFPFIIHTTRLHDVRLHGVALPVMTTCKF